MLDDGERERRPLERVVVDADDERARMVRRVQQGEEPEADEPERDDDRYQAAVDVNPFSDCFSTRQPVAKTVRR